MDDISGHYFEVEGIGLIPSIYRVIFLMGHVLYIELFSGQTQFRVTLKRICVYLILFCALPMLVLWNHVGLYLDDLLFDGWRVCKIERPMFIVGNARSGTTWFHRLITNIDNDVDQDASRYGIVHDNPKYTTFKTWEILFAVSITWKQLLYRVHALDKIYLRGMIVRVVSLIEDGLLGDAHMRERYVHPIGLMNAEEDEWLMMHIGCSQLILFFFPLGFALLHPLVVFDDSNSGAQLSVATRRMIFYYYRDCVRRHLYFRRYLTTTTMDNRSNQLIDGDTRRTTIFVSKNPTFTLRLGTVPYRSEMSMIFSI